MENNVRMPMQSISNIIWKWLRETFNDAKQVSTVKDLSEEWSILTGVYQKNVVLEKLPHGYILCIFHKDYPTNKTNLMKITEPFRAETIGIVDASVGALVERLNFEYRRSVAYGLNLNQSRSSSVDDITSILPKTKGELNMNIKKVMFNTVKGITTVIFDDGTHVMTKTSKDEGFDPEVGLAMCIAKKHYGSRNKFKKVVAAAMDESKEYNEKRLRKMMKKADTN